MARHWWNREVCIRDKRAGVTRVVTSIDEVARLLYDQWPAEFHGSEKYRAAALACIAVHEGKELPYVARALFVEAAKEAGIFVREGR